MWLWIVLALVFAVFEWASELSKSRWGIYFSKPVVMILLLIWIWLYSDLPTLLEQKAALNLFWFVLGLSFCLGGDIFLIFPERLFLPGLIFFLIGHIFYIAGFGIVLPIVSAPWYLLLAIIPLLILGVWVYRYLAKGMEVTGQTRMRIPVAVYAVVISVMLYAALSTFFVGKWTFSHALLVSVGALLFYLSDILNAISRFVGLFPRYRLWVMSTYHLAQLLLAVGATLHFSMA